MNLDIEYITDKKGKQKSVVIPEKQWKLFHSDYMKMKRKLEILSGIEDALKEVTEIQTGKRKAKTLRQILSEL